MAFSRNKQWSMLGKVETMRESRSSNICMTLKRIWIYMYVRMCVCIYEKIFWFHRGGKDKNNLYVQACKLSDVFRLLCCTVTSIIPLYIILIPALLHVILYFNISHDDNVKYKIDRERERKRNLFEK